VSQVSTTQRPSSRAAILDAAMALIRGGASISLESTARAAGLTKPGLMYHFPTKEALMTALVDALVDGYEVDLVAHLPSGSPTVEERLSAYVDWALTAHIDRADLVMFTDPRLRDRLTARWTERMRPWVDIPDDLPDGLRARLLAARLLADGSWFADASGVFPLTPQERRQVRGVARDLLEETP
jgi:AcrR family transcriptional regulator